MKHVRLLLVALFLSKMYFSLWCDSTPSASSLSQLVKIVRVSKMETLKVQKRRIPFLLYAAVGRARHQHVLEDCTVFD